MKRHCEKLISRDLKKKMVFLGGPRQVGKTTLTRSLLQKARKDAQYFNWDVQKDRQAILAKRWLREAPLVVFDELHKYPRWKSWIKGVFDSKEEDQEYLVTGSARLDTYKRGGDSLLGRYHYWRLHPLTLDEFPEDMSAGEAYNRLLKFGGFPEPFLEADERQVRRWRRERFDRILREDIRDLELIKDISTLSLMVDTLRHRTGGLVVLNHIAQDLEIAPKTAKNWLAALEKMYLLFPIYPFTRNVGRSIIKPPKVYFYDNADVLGTENFSIDAAKLENLVATTLFKRLHFLEDYHGYRCSLHYIRDKEGREVDFAVVKEGELELLVEVKLNEESVSSSLQYYTERLKPKQAVQLVGNLKRPYTKKDILITNPVDYFVSQEFFKGLD